MSYRLEFTPDVKKQLKKMDKYQATLLTRWLYRNIDGTANPREHGKALSANRAGQNQVMLTWFFFCTWRCKNE